VSHGLSNKHAGVPRPSIVAALKRETDLHDTRELPEGKEMQLFDLITIPV
jgi:hypothetical protein